MRHCSDVVVDRAADRDDGPVDGELGACSFFEDDQLHGCVVELRGGWKGVLAVSIREARCVKTHTQGDLSRAGTFGYRTPLPKN